MWPLPSDRAEIRKKYFRILNFWGLPQEAPLKGTLLPARAEISSFSSFSCSAFSPQCHPDPPAAFEAQSWQIQEGWIWIPQAEQIKQIHVFLMKTFSLGRLLWVCVF